MRVDGIVYADEKLLRAAAEDQAMEQVANVAFLPGIQNASLAMPDIHWGYGFPIGGVAAMDSETGVVSPGGVGYDISCLPAGTRALQGLGYHRMIEDFESLSCDKEELRSIESSEKVVDAQVGMFLKRKSNCLIKITTKSGKEIKATPEHPFCTPYGMHELKSLQTGDQVAVFPFEGVRYREPDDQVVVSEKDIHDLPLDKDMSYSVTELKKRGLLPLTLRNTLLPYLIKLMGFVMGDGTLYFTKNKGTIWFYGKPEDLEDIRRDISRLGFRASNIYSRSRQHSIHTHYGLVEFERTEYSFKTTSSSLAALLWAMGTPAGNKVSQDYEIPEWLLYLCPLWQKRLFIASLFGAELSSPSIISGKRFNFYTPVISINKSVDQAISGEQLISDIRQLLLDLGVDSSYVKERIEQVNKEGKKSLRFRLQMASNPENLVQLWSTIGFEYNRKKAHLANLAVHYLRKKTVIVERRQAAEKKALELQQAGISVSEIYSQTTNKYVNKRFIQRSLYEGRKTSPRIAFDFQSFSEFISDATKGLGECGLVWDEVEDISYEQFDDYVYDFNVLHKDHNFIANSFLVSNCGVRLLKTNMPYQDIKQYVEPLMHELGRNIPKGVGSRGHIKTNHKEMEEILSTGVKWAVRKGYGWHEDMEYIEERGSMAGADPSLVSKRAYERGFEQPGTLGAGNHFLELQEVVEIFDEEVARIFGLFKGQFVVMIHSGSRGLGHQVCTDFLKDMERASDSCGIYLPDRQLACAPIKSQTGRDYLAAMAAAVNYALTNRQCLAHWTRQSFETIFKKSAESMGLDVLYDISHNTAKFEDHLVDGQTKKLCVHRKGATRAFAAGHPDLPQKYKSIGQPIIIPGDMGRASYILVGTEQGEEESFASTCHGAGRLMSRKKASKVMKGFEVRDDMAKHGIFVEAGSIRLLSEEASYAYKDVSDVVDVCHNAGLSKKVAKVRPLGVVKG